MKTIYQHFVQQGLHVEATKNYDSSTTFKVAPCEFISDHLADTLEAKGSEYIKDTCKTLSLHIKSISRIDEKLCVEFYNSSATKAKVLLKNFFGEEALSVQGQTLCVYLEVCVPMDSLVKSYVSSHNQLISQLVRIAVEQSVIPRSTKITRVLDDSIENTELFYSFTL